MGMQRYRNEACLMEIFKGRIKNIMEAAIDNEVDVLVLGAFGCGAFCNPSELVAIAFDLVISENNYLRNFKEIVFAIKCNGLNYMEYMEDNNFRIFYNQFERFSKNADIDTVLFLEQKINKYQFCDARCNSYISWNK